MKILSCGEYNKKQRRKWEEDVEEWKERGEPGEIIPQIKRYFFWDEEGNKKRNGYVVISDDGRREVWGETLDKAKETMNERRLV